MWELCDLDGRVILRDRLYVEYGPSDHPGVLEEAAELGPGQDRISNHNSL